MKTYKLPPLVDTVLSPEDIIGRGHNMNMFIRFIRTAKSSTTGEYPRSRLVKEFGDDVLVGIGEAMKRLRENGYYPEGIDAVGNVIFRTALKSECQKEMEAGLDELKGMSIDELQNEARSGYLRRVKSEEDIQTVSDGLVDLMAVV